MTEAYVLHCITEGLRSLFGEIGSSFPLEIVKFKAQKRDVRLIIRCPSHCVIKVCSSLTLQGQYQGEACAFHVIRVARNLLQLSNAESRLLIAQ